MNHKHVAALCPLFASIMLMQVGCGGAHHAGADSASSGLDLQGRWVSECVDPGNGKAIRLSFDIKSDTWTLAYESFDDAACASKSLVVNIEGPYAITGPSQVVPGAHEGRFAFAKKTVTPLSDGAAAFLPQACGGNYAVGVPTDISGGCAGLGSYPIASCPADYDVVARNGDTLQFGNRPADNNMCTPDKRPTALSPIKLQRR